MATISLVSPLYWPPLVSALIIVITGYHVLAWALSTRKKLPPGPPRDPLIGHLRHLPQSQPAVVYTEWRKIYGDVIHLQALSKSYLILGSEQAAVELLDQRSAIYSDRPRFVLYDIMGWGDILSFLPYGKRHTRHRQQHHNLLARKSCPAFYPVQTREARKLVRNLLHTSGDQQHAALSRFSTAIITDILTGHEIVSDDDYFVRLAEQLYESFCVTGPPGGTLIDLFPLLRFFPDWIPGTYYARVAREWQDQVRDLYEYPVKYVQGAEANGTAQPSFLLSKLQNRGVSEEEEDLDLDELRADALTIFVTGQATTSSILTVFLLAMVLYPESQRRAQEEILHVLGADQIPAYEDRAKLPFVECVIQETLRWNPIVPLGVPHRLIQDDVYRGMLIPAGTTVYANIRAMSRDESVYHDPEAFQPERFLPRPEGRGEPRFASAFGFGRRLCTGNELASNSIWIAAATLLATCNIKNALDAAGRVIVPSTAMTDGIDCHPEHFPFAIEARSGLAALLDDEMRL